VGSQVTQKANVLKHTIIYSGATVLSKAVGFVMLPMYAHYLRGEGYGIVGMIDICLALYSAVLARGMADSIMRFYYEFDTPKERNQVVSTGLLIMLLTVPTSVCLALPFAGIVSRLMLGMEGYGYYFVLAFFSFGFNIAGASAQTYIVITQRSLFFSIVSLLRLIVGVTLNVYLIAVVKMGVLGYLYSSLICAVLFGLFWLIYAFSKVRFAFSLPLAKRMLAFVLPLIPGQFGMLVKERSGPIILRVYTEIATVGVFSMVFKFISILPLFVFTPFFRTWSPRQFELSRHETGPAIMARTFGQFISAIFFFGLCLAVLLPGLIRLMNPPEFWPGISLIPILLFGRMLVGAARFCQFGIFYGNQTKVISAINVTMAVMSIIVGIPLIKHFGLFGLAWLGCIVESMRLACCYFAAQKYYRVPYDWMAVAKMGVVVALCYLAISNMSVGLFGLQTWCTETVSPLFVWCAGALHLDTVKDGKIIVYLTENTPIVVDLMLKTVALVLFPIGLLMVGVLDLASVRELAAKIRSVLGRFRWVRTSST